MGRSPCCEKAGLKRGPWTPEEDQKLLAYIEEHGHGSWRALPAKAGLQRCGKSCRLRWTNYLRPDIKRGKFSLQEEQTIIQLHALLGNRWSAIATHLPKRTDNEIKNYWNTHLKKRLTKMGIDPFTHKPKSDALASGQGHSKSAANLSHMAQWESARLEAEARLVRESKLRSSSNSTPPVSSPGPLLAPAQLTSKSAHPCVDVLRAWQGVCSKSTASAGHAHGARIDLESPTSTLSFTENMMPVASTLGAVDNANSSAMCRLRGEGLGGEEVGWKCFGRSTRMLDNRDGMDGFGVFSVDSVGFSGAAASAWLPDSSSVGTELSSGGQFVGLGFTCMLLDNADEQNSFEGCGDSENVEGGGSSEEEEHKNYWNTILDLVNSSPPSNPPSVF